MRYLVLLILGACVHVQSQDRVVRDVAVVDPQGLRRYQGPCRYFEDTHFRTLWVTCPAKEVP